MLTRKQQITRLKTNIRRNLIPFYTLAAGLAFSIALLSITLDIIDGHKIDDSEILSRVRRSVNQTNTTTTGLEEETTFPYIGEYPKDIFSVRQLRQGAVLLHTAGMIYMFIALAIVCDEFFVPSIEVLSKKLKLTEDVAGATFMAAGGSAPELFSSVAGVFISKNSVGISTIIGSAVFNILFVIGACALAAKETLHLTWWPLFRDAIFYSISLIILIVAFGDSEVYYYEALALLACYVCYVTFMVFNGRIEKKIKGTCCKSSSPPLNDIQVRTTSFYGSSIIVKADKNLKITTQTQRASVPTRPATASMFRSGLLQLMLHSIDPLAEGRIEDREQRLRAIAQSGRKPNTNRDVRKDSNGNGATIVSNENCQPKSASGTQSNNASMELLENANNNQASINGDANSDLKPENSIGRPHSTQSAWEVSIDGNTVENGAATSTLPVEDEEENQPLDISWPKTHRKRCSYLFLAPIIFPLWLTLPDTRRADRRKFYPITFIGSIIWIAFFSIMMVWWASVLCITIEMPVEVIGLSVLAAGTSVPDLLTSVIVARKGYGDMAVSSSIGSNLFDITVGLPLPWFMSTMITVKTQPWVDVSAEGLLCSVILLFSMLLVVIISIAAFRWKMTKIMGAIYLVLYFAFLAVSILLVLNKIPCPSL